MTQAKIQGKFYPLQHDEWLNACRELTPAQRDVLYFVRTLNPYGDGLDISIAEIARQLSTDKRTVHRSTVSRALKELDAKGFIDLELLMVKITIKAKGIHCCDETTLLPTDNNRDHDATTVIMTQQARSSRNNQSPEPSTDKGSESSKINKTIKTLSEGEREAFKNFGFKKAAELPNKPTLPEKWIEANFAELYEQFFAELERTSFRTQKAKRAKPKEETVELSSEILSNLKQEVLKNV